MVGFVNLMWMGVHPLVVHVHIMTTRCRTKLDQLKSIQRYSDLLDVIRLSIAVDGLLPSVREASAVVPGPGVRRRQPRRRLRQMAETNTGVTALLWFRD